jgi:hypothetical protein
MSKGDRYRGLLAEQGVSLDSLGSKEVALDRRNALEAVKLLAEDRIPILGGDVYFYHEGRMTVAYANWYTEREADESEGVYLQRSWEKAKDYISHFPESAEKTPMFVLTPDEKAMRDHG